MTEDSVLKIKFPKGVRVTPALDLHDPTQPRQYLDLVSVGDNGKTVAHLGWIYVGDADYEWAPYVEPPPPPPPDPTPDPSSRYLAKFNVNRRAAPSSTAALVGKISAGTEVYILDGGQVDTTSYHWGRLAGEGEQWVALYKKDSAGEVIETYLARIN